MANSPALLLVFTCVLFTCCSAQLSCEGRCGEAYDRGSKCQCDYECLVHNECCKNYASVCTTRDSCKGRCGERFKRGRQCHCDINCIKYNQCCPDYESQCTLEDTALKPENTAAAAPQRTTSLCLNEHSNKTTESSTEEYTNEDEDTTYDEDLEIVDDPAETVSGNEPMTESPKEVLPDPTLPATSPPPDQLNDEVQTQDADPKDLPSIAERTTADLDEPSPTTLPEKKSSEIDEDNLHSPETQSTLVPTTSVSSSHSAANQAPTEAEGINGPPTPDDYPQSPEADSLPEQLSPTSSAPLDLPADPTIPSLNTQQPSDQTMAPNDAVEAAEPNATANSEQPDQSEADQSPPDTPTTKAEPEDPSPTVPSEDKPAPEDDTKPEEEISQAGVNETLEADPTGQPSIAEITMADLDKPSPTALPENTEAPEIDTKPLEENGQSSGSETQPLDGMDTVNLDPKDKPSTVEQTTAAPSTTTASLDNKPHAGKLNPSPATVQEKPTKPKEEYNNILDEGKPWDYQADANNDTNLCSGRPVNGLTMLKNGTLVVFRGHYFWTLDSKRHPGPAQGITDVWGIPSPIDTVFTRCNCQGKTYFFKGSNYWRFENGLMDAGFPKPISDGFGMSGNIVAALSMPKYRSRKESVFFFKRGGLAQRYTYNVVPQCGRKRFRRAAGSTLGEEITVSKTWFGFPSTITSAVSVTTMGGDGYKYYVFSPSKYYSLKMEGETPLILTPKAGPGMQKSAKSWFRCPQNQKASNSAI